MEADEEDDIEQELLRELEALQQVDSKQLQGSTSPNTTTNDEDESEDDHQLLQKWLNRGLWMSIGTFDSDKFFNGLFWLFMSFVLPSTKFNDKCQQLSNVFIIGLCSEIRSSKRRRRRRRW